MKVLAQIQRSPEWYEAKAGKVSSSRIAAVEAKLARKDGEAAARANLKLDLLAEGLSGLLVPHYVSKLMQEGLENEPLARTAYELHTGNEVEQTGFIQHPTIDRAGASPDGLVGEDGLIEIKCPATATHVEYLLAGIVPEEYEPQMMWQMACTGRQWVDFVSFDCRLPEHLQLFIRRLDRNEARISALELEVTQFIKEIDELAAKLPQVAVPKDLLGITDADIQGALHV